MCYVRRQINEKQNMSLQEGFIFTVRVMLDYTFEYQKHSKEVLAEDFMVHVGCTF